MQTTIRLQSKGLITLPKAIRNQLGLTENTRLKVSVNNGKVILEPTHSYSYPIRIYTDEEIDQFLKDDTLDPKLAKKLKEKFGNDFFSE